MEVEKYMISIEDVLEDPDVCFAHLLEGQEKKETLQEHTKRCQKYWKMMVEQRGLISILKTGICRKSVKKESIYLM